MGRSESWGLVFGCSLQIGVMMKHFDPVSKAFHHYFLFVAFFFSDHVMMVFLLSGSNYLFLFFIISRILSQLCFPVSDLSVSAMFSQIWPPLRHSLIHSPRPPLFFFHLISLTLGFCGLCSVSNLYVVIS